MTAGIPLEDLHEVPYSNVEGAYVKVKQEVTTLVQPTTEPPYESKTEVREGEIVGRAEGTGLYYSDTLGEDVADPIGPCIYLRTPEDTILEVRTDKPENELLEFTRPGER